MLDSMFDLPELQIVQTHVAKRDSLYRSTFRKDFGSEEEDGSHGALDVSCYSWFMLIMFSQMVVPIPILFLSIPHALTICYHNLSSFHDIHLQ